MLKHVARAGLIAAAVAWGTASAQTTVNYGRITNVTLVTEANRAAQTGGAILGGALGAASARNRSGGTAALRAGAGVLGGQAARTHRDPAADVRVHDPHRRPIDRDHGDRRGGPARGRLRRGRARRLQQPAARRRLALQPTTGRAGAEGRAPPKATAADVRQADACIQAKDRLLDAETEDDFERAYRRVRLLCSD